MPVVPAASLPAPSLGSRALPTLVTHLVLVPAALASAALASDQSGLDLQVAAAWWDASSQTFPWRASSWLDVIGHQAARAVPVVVGGASLVGGILGRYVNEPKTRSTPLLLTGLCFVLGPLAIAALKHHATLSCPVSLSEFGGFVSYAAEHARPLWTSQVTSAGRCSPSGHAGGGYALLALYFLGWIVGKPAWRWSGLLAGVVAGAMFSTVRIAQGADFLSATLWSAFVVWLVCCLLFLPSIVVATRRPGKTESR